MPDSPVPVSPVPAPDPVPLPADPSLTQLRRQSRDLCRAAESGESDALALFARWAPEHPLPGSERGRGGRAAPAEPSAAGVARAESTTAPGRVPLHLAQLVVARRHGFAG